MKLQLKDILIRYLLIPLIALLIPFFPLVLFPLTIFPVYFLLNLFYDVTINGNLLIINSLQIEIISACLGVSAIYLLLLLNIATPSIKWKKRLHIFLVTSALFLIFNWIRILLLSILFIQEFILFEQIHIITWQIISTVIVIVIWFFAMKIFAIKKAPFISDFLFLKKLIKT